VGGLMRTQNSEPKEREYADERYVQKIEPIKTNRPDNLSASVSLQQHHYFQQQRNIFTMVSQQQQQLHVRWRRQTSRVALALLIFMSSVDQTHGFVNLFSEHRQSPVGATTTATTVATRSLALWASTGSMSPKKKQKQQPNDDDTLHQQQMELYSSEARQLLGLKGASSSSSSTSTTAKWKIRLQLTKPVTWVPLSMIVMCGAAASGNYHWIWNPLDPTDRNVVLGLHDAALGLATVLLAGPFSEGFAQTINDWYDKDIDAINEPYRPIPSGAISQDEVFEQLWFLFLGGLSLSLGLDYATGHLDTNTANNSFPMVTAIALFGYFVSYIYSAPPLKLKQNGWAGDIAIGTCYISLPWWCGQSVFGQLDRPESWIM
jgi:4-hydroxybenzoate polyprenyltransferase